MRPITETYEGLQNSVENDDARAAWKYSDNLAHNLTQRYHELKSDPRYTNDFKAEEAWKAFDKASVKISAEKEKARSLLQKEAAYNEEMSIPRPRGESLKATSTERLLGAQNHAAKVVRMAERLEQRAAKGGSPIGRPSLPSVLKDEYARGINTGGVEGAVACRGTLMAAQELGVDADSFLNDLREDKHLESLDKARRLTTMSQAISKQVPEPPFPRPGSRARGSNNRNVLLRPRDQQVSLSPSGALGSGKRRRPWK